MWIAALALITAWGGAEEWADTVISVEMRGGWEVSAPSYNRARSTASQAFAAAGLRLEWCHRASSCQHWDERLVVTLTPVAPERSTRGAVAEAQVFEGRTIRLYQDRLRQAAPELIAHVLVHEITHLLQGVDRHSHTGVMKARWDNRDHAAMKRGALPFTADDIDLIRMGLRKRGNPARIALLAVR